MKEDNTNTLRPVTDDDFFQAARLMKAIGGGFASRIGEAFYVADMSNRARLQAAFPDLFTRYFNAYVETVKE